MNENGLKRCEYCNVNGSRMSDCIECKNSTYCTKCNNTNLDTEGLGCVSNCKIEDSNCRNI